MLKRRWPQRSQTLRRKRTESNCSGSALTSARSMGWSLWQRQLIQGVLYIPNADVLSKLHNTLMVSVIDSPTQPRKVYTHTDTHTHIYIYIQKRECRHWPADNCFTCIYNKINNTTSLYSSDSEEEAEGTPGELSQNPAVKQVNKNKTEHIWRI